MDKIRYIVVGFGYRAKFYLNIAKTFNNRYEVLCVLCKDDKHKDEIESLGFKFSMNLDEAISLNPDFFVVSIYKKELLSYSKRLLDMNLCVLQETPLSTNIDEIKNAYHDLLNKKFMVAEQYYLYPSIKKIIDICNSGIIGDINDVQISYMHGYHAISILRKLFKKDFDEHKIYVKKYKSKITETKSRYQELHTNKIKDIEGSHIIFEMNGKRAIYDFSSEQYRSPIRHQYLIIRGSRGEIYNNTLYYLDSNNNYMMENITFDKYELDDDHMAISNVLDNMKKYVSDGNTSYHLNDAIMDAYEGYLIENNDNLDEIIIKKEDIL